MKKLAAAATLILLAVCASGGLAASSTSLQPGDILIYDVTVELQQHHVDASAKNKEVTGVASGLGSQTISVYAIGSDGTAFANVQSTFKGDDNGRPIGFDMTFPAKVMPDGQMRMKNQLGGGISEAFNFANASTAEINVHATQLASGWTTVLKTPYMNFTLIRKVSGQAVYHDYPALELQSVGSGTLFKTADGKAASGTVSVSGTSYHDLRDHLLLGESLRTFTALQLSDKNSAHVNYSAAINIVLRSWMHSTATPNPNAGASALPTMGEPGGPAAPASLAPSPAPSGYGPTPESTVTPRLGY